MTSPRNQDKISLEGLVVTFFSIFLIFFTNLITRQNSLKKEKEHEFWVMKVKKIKTWAQISCQEDLEESPGPK